MLLQVRCVYNSWKRLEENFYSSPLTHYIWQLSWYFSFQRLYSSLSQCSLFVQVLFTTLCKRKQNLERQANTIVTPSPPNGWVCRWSYFQFTLKKKGNLISSWCLLCRKEDPWQRKKMQERRGERWKLFTIVIEREIIICCTIKAWHHN